MAVRLVCSTRSLINNRFGRRPLNVQLTSTDKVRTSLGRPSCDQYVTFRFRSGPSVKSSDCHRFPDDGPKHK